MKLRNFDTFNKNATNLYHVTWTRSQNEGKILFQLLELYLLGLYLTGESNLTEDTQEVLGKTFGCRSTFEVMGNESEKSRVEKCS